MQPFTERVLATIKAIPEGYVMTYGQIAELAGSRRGARQVVRILHAMSEAHGLPWHRVVNAQGRIAPMADEARFTQRLRLEEEGVEFGLDGTIALDEFRYRPDEA